MSSSRYPIQCSGRTGSDFCPPVSLTTAILRLRNEILLTLKTDASNKSFPESPGCSFFKDWKSPSDDLKSGIPA